LLESADPPGGSLDWFTESEIRAALEAGRAGKHEPAVRAWLLAKDRDRQELEMAAKRAIQLHGRTRVAMWVLAVVAVVMLVAVLLPSVLKKSVS
jgi:hypothetical protein